MIRAYVIGSFVLVSALILAQPVFAMGGDYQINPDGNIVTEQPDWPAGLAELINSGPVFSGYWVDAESVFFFLGDTASLARFLKRYSTLENTPLLVVIHAGSERRNEPWVDKPKNEYDWKVRLQKRGWGAPVKPDNPEEQWVVTVEVWIDRNIRLAELVCPKGVEVRSGGEIEGFILRTSGKDVGLAGWQTYANYNKAVRAGEENAVGEERDISDDIPAKYWSDPIKALNPIRVYLHRLNVVVVQRMENGTEEGKYFGSLISSYAPRTGDDGFVFTPDPASNNVLNFKRATGKDFSENLVPIGGPMAIKGGSSERAEEHVALPELDGSSAKGLEIECRLMKTTFVLGEPVNIWCTVKNTTNSIKPIGWHPSAGVHFCLVREGRALWEGGLLPMALPQLTQPIVAKSGESRPGYVLFIPPHESIQILLTHKAEQPVKFKGRVVYDPLAPRNGWVGRKADGPPWRNELLSSNEFEYEVAPVREQPAMQGEQKEASVVTTPGMDGSNER